jgi:hypothetical protein
MKTSTAAAISRAARLAQLQQPRPINCKVCGKRAIVKGAAALLLCPTHKKAHVEGRHRRARKARYDREKAAAAGLPVSGLPDVRDPAQPPPAPATVREAPPAARRPEGQRENATLAPGAPPPIAGTRSGSFADAIRLIAAPAERGEGYRHGWIGNTGSGKTTAIRGFLSATDQIFTLIHDDTKLDPQYDGVKCESLDQIGAAVAAEVTAITLRGDAFKGSRVEVETVAALALQIARASRQPVRLVVDELDRACTAGGKQIASESLRAAFTLGRALSVSVLWSTQTPTRCPTEVIDQSSTIALCQLGPRALNYLDERLAFDPDLLQVVPTLAIGQFVIYEAGRPWNRTIYQTPAD